MIGASLPKGLVNPFGNDVANVHQTTTHSGLPQQQGHKLSIIFDNDIADKQDKGEKAKNYCDSCQDVDDDCSVIPAIVCSIAF